MATSEFVIALIPGDGIGDEVTRAAVDVLNFLEKMMGGFKLRYDELYMGAQCYRETGVDMSEQTLKSIRAADAILLGAIGLPSIRFPDGTEISPHLKVREELGLYCGVRPVKAYPNSPRRLSDDRAGEIDFVIIRESSEGLFYTQGRGEVIDDFEARETLRITRPTCEKLFDRSFEIARKRKAKGGIGKVTCVDKANVFKAYAFFRKIFDERALNFPDIIADHNYVDAQALDLIRRPWEFDVLVAENMFADILSDLAGGLVGGMGMAACAEIGENHALFQPAHGSAPDIAGQGKANPLATILSAAMMLDWLGTRYQNEGMSSAARLIDDAVWKAFADSRLNPIEFGGPHGTVETTDIIVETIEQLRLS
jgi:3-isopropylmalate dehydrogenase